jgi:hypothetical protein
MSFTAATASFLCSSTVERSEPNELVPSDVELGATSRLVLTQAVAYSARSACTALDGPLRLSLREGDEIPFTGAIQVSVTDGEHGSFPRRFLGLDRAIIRSLANR